SSRNRRQYGSNQFERFHNNGDTPCATAAAIASRHSRSSHAGVALPGCASSAAIASVVRRRPASMRLSGGNTAQRLDMITGWHRRRGRVGIAMEGFACDQRIPARGERHGCLARGFGSAGVARLLQGNLIVQQVAYATVERRVVGPAEHHGKVAAVAPMGLVAELGLHLFKEPGTRKWVRDADADVVGCSERYEFPGRDQIGELLTEIAELDEEADMDAMAAEPLSRIDQLGDPRALVHPVEHALAATLGADPRFRATGTFERGGHRLGAQVGTSLDREWHHAVIAAQALGKFVHPIAVESEDIVGEPDVVGAERVLQVTHFRGDFAGVAAAVMIAPDRLGAPVAVERAAPRSRHVEAEVTVTFQP